MGRSDQKKSEEMSRDSTELASMVGRSGDHISSPRPAARISAHQVST